MGRERLLRALVVHLIIIISGNSCGVPKLKYKKMFWWIRLLLVETRCLSFTAIRATTKGLCFCPSLTLPRPPHGNPHDPTGPTQVMPARGQHSPSCLDKPGKGRTGPPGATKSPCSQAGSQQEMPRPQRAVGMTAKPGKKSKQIQRAQG